MLVPPEALAELSARLGARSDRLRVIVVPYDGDPLRLVRAGADVFATAAYFGREGHDEIGGLGTSWRVAASGPDRFRDLQEAIDARGPGRGVRYLTGFSYSDRGPVDSVWDDFPASTAVLPAISAVRSPVGGSLAVAIPAGHDPQDVLDVLGRLEEPGDPTFPAAADHRIAADPSPDEWMAGVGEALSGITMGLFDKVVLARSLRVSSHPAADGMGLIEMLRKRQPGSFVFGWRQADAVFLGASPELLVARSGDLVRAEPHAGSAPRGEGEAADREFGEELMASSKERAEHALVVRDIVDRLGPLTSSLEADEVPRLRRITNVQHLVTRISGRLERSSSLLELAGSLHPTPAVAGTPRTDALAFIDKMEQVDRGWYAGGIGWSTGDGDGEIAVALRCGLVRGDTTHLYAGNGIVAGSVPESELAETRLKLRPLLDLLTAP